MLVISVQVKQSWTSARSTSDAWMPACSYAFVAAMRVIHAEALSDPERVKAAPHGLPVKRLDELGAARNPNVAW